MCLYRLSCDYLTTNLRILTQKSSLEALQNMPTIVSILWESATVKTGHLLYKCGNMKRWINMAG